MNLAPEKSVLISPAYLAVPSLPPPSYELHHRKIPNLSNLFSIVILIIFSYFSLETLNHNSQPPISLSPPPSISSTIMSDFALIVVYSNHTRYDESSVIMYLCVYLCVQVCVSDIGFSTYDFHAKKNGSGGLRSTGIVVWQISSTQWNPMELKMNLQEDIHV
ncbi:hypothetical protein LXL04_011164 [Taraxacum kok-saghyz]